MLSIIERVIILQSVDVFSDVPSEELSHVAAVTTELSHGSEETIFQINDPSDAMYVVLDGEVKLSRGRQVVTVAGVDEAFGTWSLFDDEPRVVDAITTRETHLLKLEKDDFMELLADNVGITQGVLKGIVKRLRGVAGRVKVDNG